jgi:hypothetical protein
MHSLKIINRITAWVPMQDPVFGHSCHFKLPLHSAFCTRGELTVQCCQADMYMWCYHFCTLRTNPNFTSATEIHSNWCWNFLLSFSANHWHSIMLYHSRSVSKLERNSTVSENSLSSICILEVHEEQKFIMWLKTTTVDWKHWSVYSEDWRIPWPRCSQSTSRVCYWQRSFLIAELRSLKYGWVIASSAGKRNGGLHTNKRCKTTISH